MNRAKTSVFWMLLETRNIEVKMPQPRAYGRK